METFLHMAPCLMFASSDDGILLEANEHFCIALEYQQADIIGSKLDQFLTVASRIFQQTHFFPLLKLQGYANEIFLTLKKKDGTELPILLNAERKIVDEKAVNIYVGIIVSNRKKFEDELIVAKKKAEASAYENNELKLAKEKLQHHAEELDRQIYLVKKQNEELKQFNKVISHDMQEPLRKISLYGGLLLEKTQKQEQEQVVDKIRQVSDHLRDIFVALQQYVWLNESPFEMEPIDFTALLHVVKTDIEKQHPEVALKVEVTRLENVTANKAQVHLMLFHLLSNAIRFRKEPATALVQVNMNRLQRNQFRSIDGKYKYIDFVRLQVADTGVGFQPEFAPQVFDLFRKLHPQSGTGVGLSICKKVVENHHGTISIDSRLNEGTTVTIHLPLMQVNSSTLPA